MHIFYYFVLLPGGGALGGVDSVGRILELCNAHDAWLHVEGHALAALTLPNTPNLVSHNQTTIYITFPSPSLGLTTLPTTAVCTVT